MNIVLNCAAKKGLGAFNVYKEGFESYYSVFKVGSREERLKGYILGAVLEGLKYAKGIVAHEDLLLINIQNSQIVDWLSFYEDKKEYNYILDVIYDVLDSVDCRVMFVFDKVKSTFKRLEEGPSGLEVSSVSSLLKELE